MADLEKLKSQYDMGYITESTLKTWVRINKIKTGRGITEKQFQEITGKKYKA